MACQQRGVYVGRESQLTGGEKIRKLGLRPLRWLQLLQCSVEQGTTEVWSQSSNVQVTTLLGATRSVSKGDCMNRSHLTISRVLYH